jgi:hypothetical protein
VYAGQRNVGRIFKAEAGHPQETPWMWTPGRPEKCTGAHAVLGKLHRRQASPIPCPRRKESGLRPRLAPACSTLEHRSTALAEAALGAGHDGVSRREESPGVVLGVKVGRRASAAA